MNALATLDIATQQLPMYLGLLFSDIHREACNLQLFGKRLIYTEYTDQTTAQ